MITLLISLAAATILAQQTTQTAGDSFRDLIVAQERAELDALKSGDVETFGNLIADDAVFLNAGGPAGKTLVVQHSSVVRLHDYTMSDVQVISVSPIAGLIVYKLDETGASHGKEFTASIHASALWVKRGDRWQCVFSQETPVRRTQ